MLLLPVETESVIVTPLTHLTMDVVPGLTAPSRASIRTSSRGSSSVVNRVSATPTGSSLVLPSVSSLASIEIAPVDLGGRVGPYLMISVNPPISSFTCG